MSDFRDLEGDFLDFEDDDGFLDFEGGGLDLDDDFLDFKDEGLDLEEWEESEPL